MISPLKFHSESWRSPSSMVSVRHCFALRFVSPSSSAVSMKHRPFGSDVDSNRVSAATNWLLSNRMTSPTCTSDHLASTNLPLRSVFDLRLFTCESEIWRCWKENTDWQLRSYSVVFCTHNIIIRILNSRQSKYSYQGNCCGHWGEWGYRGYQLEDQQAEEIEVGQPLKLLQQIEWQKREQRILGGLDVVVL